MTAAPAPTWRDAAPAIGESARHLVWRYSADESRAAVAALLTLESEIAASARPGIEHTVAHARLAWWDDETAALARGRPRHPLGAQLAAAFDAAALSPPDLRGLVEVARLDLACTAFETAPELAEYLSLWSGSVFRSLGLLLCPDSSARADVERFSKVAGTAIRDIELVARLAADARIGRVHIALTRQDAQSAAADPGEYAPWQRQPWATPDVALLRARLAARRAALAGAAAALPTARRAPLRAAAVWCALAARRADRAVADLPLQYHAGRFDQLGDTWTAWRAALAASRGGVPRSLKESR